MWPAVGSGSGGGLTRVTVNHPALDVAVHIHVAAPSSKVIFVANPTAAPIPAEVSTGGHLGTVQEIWDGREVRLAPDQALSTVVFKSPEAFLDLIRDPTPYNFAEAYVNGRLDFEGG